MTNPKLMAKAVQYVLEGKVRVESVVFHDDGRIDEAHGFIKGETGTWMTHISGNVATCNCPWGTARQDASEHAHDIALELAAKGHWSATNDPATGRRN